MQCVHCELLSKLLTFNAVGNHQGELPQHVASKEHIKSLILEWDVSQTEALV